MVEGGRVREPVRLTLVRGGTVAGRVIAPTGKPAGYAEVLTAPAGGRPDEMKERREVMVGARPPDLEIVSRESADLKAVVEMVEPLGGEVLLHVRQDGVSAASEIRLLTTPESAGKAGEHVGLRLRLEALHFFDPGTGRRLP